MYNGGGVNGGGVNGHDGRNGGRNGGGAQQWPLPVSGPPGNTTGGEHNRNPEYNPDGTPNYNPSFSPPERYSSGGGYAAYPSPPQWPPPATTFAPAPHTSSYSYGNSAGGSPPHPSLAMSSYYGQQANPFAPADTHQSSSTYLMDPVRSATGSQRSPVYTLSAHPSAAAASTSSAGSGRLPLTPPPPPPPLPAAAPQLAPLYAGPTYMHYDDDVGGGMQGRRQGGAGGRANPQSPQSPIHPGESLI